MKTILKEWTYFNLSNLELELWKQTHPEWCIAKDPVYQVSTWNQELLWVGWVHIIGFYQTRTGCSETGWRIWKVRVPLLGTMWTWFRITETWKAYKRQGLIWRVVVPEIVRQVLFTTMFSMLKSRAKTCVSSSYKIACKQREATLASELELRRRKRCHSKSALDPMIILYVKESFWDTNLAYRKTSSIDGCKWHSRTSGTLKIVSRLKVASSQRKWLWWQITRAKTHPRPHKTSSAPKLNLLWAYRRLPFWRPFGWKRKTLKLLTIGIKWKIKTCIRTCLKSN